LKKPLKNRRKSYSIKFTDGGLRDVKLLRKGERNALKKELTNKLASDPTAHSDPLQGPLEGFRSFHFGKHRIIFRIFEDLAVIAVLGVGKHSPDARRDVYRRLEAFVETARHVEKALAALRGFTEPRK
jgi:addiction module RelE/StbE family toxin